MKNKRGIGHMRERVTFVQQVGVSDGAGGTMQQSSTSFVLAASVEKDLSTTDMQGVFLSEEERYVIVVRRDVRIVPNMAIQWRGKTMKITEIVQKKFEQLYYKIKVSDKRT